MRQVPAHKVKLFVGAGGEKIKWIQRKSKCRVQVGTCRCHVDELPTCSEVLACSLSLTPASTSTAFKGRQQPPAMGAGMHRGRAAVLRGSSAVVSAWRVPFGRHICDNARRHMQVKKDKEDLTKQWGTTGILGTLEGHARGIQASSAMAALHVRLHMLTEKAPVSAASVSTPILPVNVSTPHERCYGLTAGCARFSAGGPKSQETRRICASQRTKDGEVKMVTVMLIGQADCCDKAKALIEEAMDNKEEKQKQRQKEYAKKRDAKVSCF